MSCCLMNELNQEIDLKTQCSIRQTIIGFCNLLTSLYNRSHKSRSFFQESESKYFWAWSRTWIFESFAKQSFLDIICQKMAQNWEKNIKNFWSRGPKFFLLWWSRSQFFQRGRVEVKFSRGWSRIQAILLRLHNLGINSHFSCYILVFNYKSHFRALHSIIFMSHCCSSMHFFVGFYYLKPPKSFTI